MLSSVAWILRKNSESDKELILIIPSHPRLADDRMAEVYKYFDKIIQIPYYEISGHIIHAFTGILRSRKFNKELLKVNFEKNALFFCADVFKYTDVLIFNHVQKKKCKIIVLSAFIGKRYDRCNLVVNWHSSLIFFLYSLLTSKPTLFLNCKIRNTSITGYKLFQGMPDYVLKIESSGAILKPKIKSFERLPFPLILLDENRSKGSDEKTKLLLLVSSLHGKRYAHYWNVIRDMIKNLPGGIEVFIKDHPRGGSVARGELKELDVTLLNRKQNMELLVLQKNINIVLGHGSTGLITASWMGLSVYDFSKLLNYGSSFESYYDEYMKMGYDIRKFEHMNDIDELRKEKTGRPVIPKVKISLRWGEVITEIERDQKCQ